MSLQEPALESVRQALAAAARLPRFRSAGGSTGARAAGAGAGGGGHAGLGGGGSVPARPTRVPRRDALVTLVQRITQGFDPVDVAHARAIGYDAYLEEQLDHLAIDDSALEARLAPLTTLPLSPRELVGSYSMDTALPIRELQQAAVLRALYSKRQLFERTCEFWTDHFNVHHAKGLVWAFQGKFDREVVRRYALGTLHELLAASAASPAMLVYLDNWLNYAGAPQENYGRELLELHSMKTGYTEDDVHQVARCFTGWTLDLDPKSSEFLEFRFRAHLHDYGPKDVLGFPVPADPAGNQGFRVIEFLCARSETARHVAGELVSWFLTPEPPPAFVEEHAELLVANAGAVKPVLRSILARENLEWSSPVFAPKFRRPFHFTTSLLRTLHAQVTDAEPLVERLAAMGQAPYDWPTPTGYPDSVEAWGSSLLPRWSFASELLAGGVPGVFLPVQGLLAFLRVTGPESRAGLARRIDHTLLADSLSEEEERLVQQLVDSRTGPLAWGEVGEAIALAVSMPGYQWF